MAAFAPDAGGGEQKAEDDNFVEDEDQAMLYPIIKRAKICFLKIQTIARGLYNGLKYYKARVR